MNSYVPAGMNEDNGVHISFDDECRIRVLDPEQFKHSEMLEEECRGFVDKMKEFNTSVHSIVEALHENAARIDKEKLRAIGQRNKVRACGGCWRPKPPLSLLPSSAVYFSAVCLEETATANYCTSPSLSYTYSNLYWYADGSVPLG